MTLTYEQTEQDYIDFNFYYYWERPERLWSRILSRILPVPLFVALISTRIADYGLVEILLISLGFLFSIFATPYFKWRNKIRIKRVIKSGKNADIIGSRTIHFTEEGITESTKNSHGEIKWDAFEYLRETEKYLFLFVTVNQAIIFPKRIFVSIDEIEAVKSFIGKKVTPHNRQNNDTGK